MDNRLKLTLNKKHLLGDFPGGQVVKNPPANAGDTDSIPGPGTNIPHATTGQLGPYTTTMIPHSRVCALLLQNPHTLELCSTREATAVRSPCTATRVALTHCN